LHIAQIGTGRVGRPTAYTIMCSGLASEITVCDIKPELASAFAEELQHVVASLGLDVEINPCEKDDEVAGADIVLIQPSLLLKQLRLHIVIFTHLWNTLVYRRRKITLRP